MITYLSQKTPETIKKIYRILVGAIPVRISLGTKYWSIRKYIDKNDFLSKEDLELLQLKKIKKIVEYAYINVDGYKQLYSEANISPKDINSFEDFRRLPIVTKEIIRDNLNDFTSKNLGFFNKEYTATGGSSGIPFGFFRTRLNNYSEPAYIHSGWSRSGWEPDNLSVVLRGQYVGSKNLFYYFNKKTKELSLSSYYLTSETYQAYKSKILSKKFIYLQAYPSAASILSDLVIENGDCNKFPFKIIFLGSENIYDFQLEKIKKAFPSSQINHWYGHSEQAILGQVCEFSDDYHISPTYGFTEILDVDKEEVIEGGSGQLVGTSFWNYGTPFIRYQTDDIAVKGSSFCKKCGRSNLLLKNIEGRKQEIIVSEFGRHISMTAINMHSDVFKNIKQFQFHQKRVGEVCLNVIQKKDFTANDQLKIKNEIQKKLGDDLMLSIKLVESIEKTPQGKYRFLIQELDIKYGE